MARKQTRSQLLLVLNQSLLYFCRKRRKKLTRQNATKNVNISIEEEMMADQNNEEEEEEVPP